MIRYKYPYIIGSRIGKNFGAKFHPEFNNNRYINSLRFIVTQESFSSSLLLNLRTRELYPLDSRPLLRNIKWRHNLDCIFHRRIFARAVLRIDASTRESLTEDSRSIIKFPKRSPFDGLPDARMGATVEPRGSTSNAISLSPGLSPFVVRRLYTTAGLPSTPHTKYVLRRCLWQTYFLGYRRVASVRTRADS